jgi:hypothetical protein
LQPESVSTKQERIAKLARENPTMAFTSLNHYPDAEWMEYAEGAAASSHLQLGRRRQIGLACSMTRGWFRQTSSQRSRPIAANTARQEMSSILPLLVDGLQAEREQGITIDVAYRFFATAHRAFIVADTRVTNNTHATWPPALPTPMRR